MRASFLLFWRGMDQKLRPQAILILMSSLIGLLVTACAPSASDQPSATRPTLLQPLSTPTLIEKEGVNVVLGGVSGKLESHYDDTTRVMKVSGPFEVAPYGGGTPLKLDLQLIGTMIPGAERVTSRNHPDRSTRDAQPGSFLDAF